MGGWREGMGKGKSCWHASLNPRGGGGVLRYISDGDVRMK